MANNRTGNALHAVDAPATTNINGVANGGLVSASIQHGKDRAATGVGGGEDFTEVDHYIQFVRGTVTSQDIPDIMSIINGAVDTYVFFEEESGLTKYTKNLITKPVIHAASFSLTNFSPGQITWGFECRGASASDTVSTMWARTPTQDPPDTQIAVIRCDQILGSGTHGVDGGATALNHIIGVTANIQGQLIRGEPGDGDTCYMAVDVAKPWSISGTLTTQDTDVAVSLSESVMGDLVLPLNMMSGAAGQSLTIKNVQFGQGDASVQHAGYTGHTLNWSLSSGASSGTPITLANAIVFA